MRLSQVNKKLELAIRMANKSTSRFRLGAVLFHRNQVISTGYNCMKKTHPLQQKFSRKEITLGLHAEIHACLGVSVSDLIRSEIYVARILRNGSLALAKPCQVCQKFLEDVGISKVTYTTAAGHEVMSL